MSDSNTKDGQFIIDKMRVWMQAELDKYASTKHEFQTKEHYLRMSDLIVIFTSSKPFKMNESVLQTMVKKAIFFDFPKLKQLKVIFASELQKIESQYKEMDFSSKKDGDDEDDDEDEDGDEDEDEVTITMRF